MNLELTKHFIRLARPARIAALLALILFSNVLELLGISLFIPVIELFSNSGSFGAKYAAILDVFFPASRLFGNLYALLALLSLAFVGKAAISLVVRSLTLSTCAEIQHGLRSTLFERLVFSNVAFFHSQKQGVLLSILGEHVIRSGQVLFVLVQFAAQWLTAAVYLAFVIFISWKLTLVVILPGILCFPIIRWMGRRANYYGHLQAREQEESQHLGWETFQAKKTISAMGLEGVLTQRFKGMSAALSSYWENTAYWSNLTSTTVQPVSAVVLSIIILASLHYRISIAELGAFCLAFLRLAPSIQGGIAMGADVAANEPSITTVFSLLDQAKEQAAPSRGVVNKRIETGITFNNVSFGYSPDSLIFTDLNLILPRGKMTALVGKSGAGKTTVVDLAVGLYRPLQGEIKVDDTPLNALDPLAYRKKIAYVGQEPFLLHDSVRNNLIFGLEHSVKDEELKALCETVGAWDFVASRPEGLDSVLGDRAVQLSGGQRQRLALARALLRRPELLILDEATSALDSETETAIADALARIQQDGEVTIVIVAHRYTTIRSADSIIEIGRQGAKTLGTWNTAKKHLIANSDEFSSENP